MTWFEITEKLIYIGCGAIGAILAERLYPILKTLIISEFAFFQSLRIHPKPVFLRVADHAPYPGARYLEDGFYSGEWFYYTHLRRAYRRAQTENRKLMVDLDFEEAGYAVSFLAQAFGMLSSDFGKTDVLARLLIVSYNDPRLISAVNEYVRNPEKALTPARDCRGIT